jgi:hypothetical protein
MMSEPYLATQVVMMPRDVTPNRGRAIGQQSRSALDSFRQLLRGTPAALALPR